VARIRDCATPSDSYCVGPQASVGNRGITTGYRISFGENDADEFEREGLGRRPDDRALTTNGEQWFCILL
jgi:hypothetical protein